jgi:toxin ParE1/3/4
MTEGERPWIVRLTAAAEADYQNIIAWTLEQFGDLQARVHADTLSAALVELTAGPTTVGAKERSEIGKGIFTLHVARGGRKGRHFVLLRIGPDTPQSQIEVLRLLHDAMDLKLHTPGT